MRRMHQADQRPNTLTDEEKAAGWKLLFDGQTTAGWRNYRQTRISDGWKVEDGALTRVAGGAGDIITVDQYAAFELCLEYLISKEGNSGVMFHVTEAESDPWRTGPEIQVQDNKDGHDPQKSGWLYQLYRSDTDATKPVGQWNQLRILITPTKCEQYMNGVKYCEYVKGSADWDAQLPRASSARCRRSAKPPRDTSACKTTVTAWRSATSRIRVIESKIRLAEPSALIGVRGNGLPESARKRQHGGRSRCRRQGRMAAR